MDGARTSAQALGLAMVLLVMAMTIPVQGADSGEDSADRETLRDGRVIGVLTMPDQTYERTWPMLQGEWTSIGVDCDQCTVVIEVDGSPQEVTSTLNIQAITDGTASMSITSPIEEFVAFSLIETIDENHPTVRPSPGEPLAFEPAWVCDAGASCFDLNQSLESTPSTEFTSDQFLLGVLEQNLAEHLSVPVTAGTTMELQFLHATSDLFLEVYHQGEEELLMETNITHLHQLPINDQPSSTYWHADSDGRFILKVSSQSPNTAYALKRVLLSADAEPQVIEMSGSTIVEGHHEKNIALATNDTQVIIGEALHRNVTGEWEQLVNGDWLSSKSVHFSIDEPTHLYPYPNASAYRLELVGQRFAVELSKMDFADLGGDSDAPSLRPSSSLMENSSWPELHAPSDPVAGELTLAIHDTADVYKIEIEGFEESLHLVQVKVLGEDLDVLRLEMWDIDQISWEVVDFREVERVNGKLQSALELTPGTHFIRVSHTDAVNVTNHTWGEHVQPVSYMISTGYTMIDEGNEPYFPPDDATVMWGGVARWVMGLLFLLPCLYFAVSFVSNRNLALEMSMKTEQLAWFKSQMDTGVTAPTSLRKSLDKSLQAIAQLDWATACSTWGPTDGEHRTDGLAMAVWSLDPRLAKKENTHPIMLGIHVLQGQWELAALRFDAPEGQAWEVVGVEPKFLHRGEEIFVDTMRQGNLTFLTLELRGSANSVDIELNGRCDGEPMAARIPHTLHIQMREEE
ncbi:MAG: hypothetical protein QNL47_07795 [Euryarchaeota archaeon]